MITPETSLSEAIADFRDQIQAATSKKKPKQLDEITGAYRDSMKQLLPTLREDPLLAAMAFHGQIQFTAPSVANEICGRDKTTGEDWADLKMSIAVRPAAHAAVKTLEDAGFQDVLVFAIALNYKVNGARQQNPDDEDDESSPERDHEHETEQEEHSQ